MTGYLRRGLIVFSGSSTGPGRTCRPRGARSGPGRGKAAAVGRRGGPPSARTSRAGAGAVIAEFGRRAGTAGDLDLGDRHEFVLARFEAVVDGLVLRLGRQLVDLPRDADPVGDLAAEGAGALGGSDLLDRSGSWSAPRPPGPKGLGGRTRRSKARSSFRIAFVYDMAEPYPSFTSNSDRGTPDWRMIDRSVPILSSLWSGTGTVVVPDSSWDCITIWLLRRRTSTNPYRARMAQASCPESTRSLPNRHLKVCDVSLLKCPALDFRGRSALEEEFHSLPQVVTRLLDGVTLACDV